MIPDFMDQFVVMAGSCEGAILLEEEDRWAHYDHVMSHGEPPAEDRADEDLDPEPAVPGFIAAMVDPDWREVERQRQKQELVEHLAAMRQAWGLTDDSPISLVPMVPPDVEAEWEKKTAAFLERAAQSTEAIR